MYYAVQDDLDFSPVKVGGEQNARILEHLQGGRVVTAYDALRLFGCLRLAARIHDIRRMGYSINKGTMQTDTGKRVAIYSMGSNER